MLYTDLSIGYEVGRKNIVNYTDTYFIAPSNGLVIVEINYQPNQYCYAEIINPDVNSLGITLSVSNNSLGSAGSTNSSAPIFKGQRVKIIKSNIGGEKAYFFPFTNRK